MKVKKSLVEQIIKEEAIKMRKLMVLKEEKLQIIKQLNELYEEENALEESAKDDFGVKRFRAELEKKLPAVLPVFDNLVEKEGFIMKKIAGHPIVGKAFGQMCQQEAKGKKGAMANFVALKSKQDAEGTFALGEKGVGAGEDPYHGLGKPVFSNAPGFNADSTDISEEITLDESAKDDFGVKRFREALDKRFPSVLPVFDELVNKEGFIMKKISAHPVVGKEFMRKCQEEANGKTGVMASFVALKNKQDAKGAFALGEKGVGAGEDPYHGLGKPVFANAPGYSADSTDISEDITLEESKKCNLAKKR